MKSPHLHTALLTTAGKWSWQQGSAEFSPVAIDMCDYRERDFLLIYDKKGDRGNKPLKGATFFPEAGILSS